MNDPSQAPTAKTLEKLGPEVSIEDLARAGVPVKKYTEKDARLFSVRGQVARIPQGVRYGLQVENPVPLLDTEGKLIGSARVDPQLDGTVLADALFQYGCPERLSIEAGLSHFFHPEMEQKFLYLKPEDFSKFGLEDVPPGTKSVTFVVVTVKRLRLAPEQRLDSNIDPVVALSEEESA